MVDNGFVYNGFLWVPAYCMDYGGGTTAAVGGQQYRPEDFYQAYYSHNTEMPSYDEPVDTLIPTLPLDLSITVVVEQESHCANSIRCHSLQEQEINQGCERLRELFWGIGKVDLGVEKEVEG